MDEQQFEPPGSDPRGNDGRAVDERWNRLSEDLGAQADAFEALEHHSEAGEIARAELASLTLGQRLRGALGHEVVVTARGAGPLRGVVLGAGQDWLLLDDRVRETLVRLFAILSVTGLGPRARSDHATSDLVNRWGLGHMLRRHARDRAALRVVLVSGDVVTGTVDMVGADHLELAEHPPGELRRRESVTAQRLVPFAAISTVTRENRAR